MKPTDITQRFDSLVEARRTQDHVMQDVGRLVTPYRAEFYKPLTTASEVQWNRGEIFDATAPANCNILASKMHTNLTSPSVKWFGLRFRDEDMNTESEAKEWLEDSESRLWQAIQESDFNTEASEAYLDLVSFGTAMIMVEEKDDIEWQGMDFTALPVQDCYFEMGGDQLPSKMYRKIRYTKLQVQERFDVPDDFQWGDDGSDVDTKYDVIFCVYWRDRDMEVDGLLTPEKRPVGYKYIFRTSNHELEEGGYYHYPGMVVRWQKVAGTDWGFSPSMVALADIRQLNDVVAQNSEARAKHIDPPLKSTDRGVVDDTDIVPGAVVYVDQMDDLAPLFPPIDMRPGIEEQDRLQEALGRYYYLDMLQMKESPAMTATEARMRYEEIMSMMAPTLGRLQNDFLKPTIEKMFLTMMRKGRFDEMPESLDNADLDIHFTGPLPRAMRGEIAFGIESWLGGVGGMAEIFPQAMDIPDIDATVRELADLKGVPAKLLRDQEEVDAQRAARAEQEAAMQQAMAMQEAGAGMKAVGEGGQALKAVDSA